MAKIYLFNTADKEKQAFKPIKAGQVGLYTCGPTVYNYAHIGNLRAYLFADVLKRALLRSGHKVKHIMNVTDVGHLTSDADTGEDKIEKRARQQHKSAWDIAKFYESAFNKDLKRLNILFPDKFPRATDHIKEQINLIKILEKKGYTYRIEDGIYFDISKFKDYDKFAKLDRTGQLEGARIDVKGKKHANDFALWKFSPGGKKRQMEWDSPWGVGFPGWHLECSAMSMKYLGKHFDIHTGGWDHIPVHHPNEIAQSEAAISKKWVNYWLHANFLVLKDREKMAKSGENFITLQVVVDKGFDPLAYRLFFLTAHYRKNQMFDWEAIRAAQNSLERIYGAAVWLKRFKGRKTPSIMVPYLNKLRHKFDAMLYDDLNMPKALSYVFELMSDVNNLKEDGTLVEKDARRAYELLLDFDTVLGLEIEKGAKYISKPLTAALKKLIDAREKARLKKDWKKADRLRDELRKKGVTVQDTPSGAVWRWVK